MFALDMCTPCCDFWFFLICLNRLSCLFTCSSVCVIHSNLSIDSDLFVTSTSAEYPVSIIRCIDQEHFINKMKLIDDVNLMMKIGTCLLLSSDSACRFETGVWTKKHNHPQYFMFNHLQLKKILHRANKPQRLLFSNIWISFW